MSDDQTTIDHLFGGAVQCAQPSRGYRFSIDSAILAGHLRTRDLIGPLLDLGAGVGVIGCAIAATHGSLRVDCVEVQPELAALCRQNIARNALGDRVSCYARDARVFADEHPGEYGTVVMNPPYFEPGRGRVSATGTRGPARHEMFGTIHELTAAARRLLRHEGTLWVVYPARFFPRLLDALRGSSFALSLMRAVLPRPSEDATTMLIEAVATEKPRELRVAPPLVLRDGDDYSVEAIELLGMHA